MIDLPERELRGLGIVSQGAQVRRITDALFVVNSSKGIGSYEVAWDRGRELWTCQCGDFATFGGPCKHIHGTRWAATLPLVLLSNAGVTRGTDAMDPNPRLTYLGRSVRVSELLGLYREALSRLRYLGPPNPGRLPHPKFTSRGAESGSTWPGV